MSKVLAGVSLDDNIVLPSKSDVLLSKDKSISTKVKVNRFKVINLDTFLLEDVHYTEIYSIIGLDNSNKDYYEFDINSFIEDDIFKVSAKGIDFEVYNRVAVFINDNLCGEGSVYSVYFYYGHVSLNYDLITYEFEITAYNFTLYSTFESEYCVCTFFLIVYASFLSNSSVIRELQNGVYTVFEYSCLALPLEDTAIIPMGIKKLVLIIEYPEFDSIVIPPSVTEFSVSMLFDYLGSNTFSITFNLSRINKDLIINKLLKELRTFNSNYSDKELLDYFDIHINVY